MKLIDRKEKMMNLILRWQQSGHSQKAFAHEHGIKLFTFRYWVQKCREQPQTADSFLQLGASSSATSVVIRYPNGCELQMPAGTPLSTIKVLLSL